MLLPALADNPSVSEAALDELAVAGSRSVMEALLASPRVMGSPRLLQALHSNQKLRPKEFAEIAKKLARWRTTSAAPRSPRTEVETAEAADPK